MSLKPLEANYRRQCTQEGFAADDHQLLAVTQLDSLLETLHRRSRFFKPMLRRFFPEEGRGMYLYGPVGRGKTMLMDLFFAQVQLPKRRLHFHEFMRHIHERLGVWGQPTNRLQHPPSINGMPLVETGPLEAVPLEAVIREISQSLDVLCLDEFEIKDIADAMIMGRLIKGLLGRGVTFVTTSNCAPDDLYENGLHRDRFMPAIAILKERLTCMSLNSPVDYRLGKTRRVSRYFSPLNEETAHQFTQAFQAFISQEGRGGLPQPRTIDAWQRKLFFDCCVNDVLWTGFEQLCKGNFSASDYLAMAGAFKIIFLNGLPALDSLSRDEVRRLILLVDVLYDQHIILYIRSQSPLETFNKMGGEWAFEFQRTYSRLMEMQSW